MAISNEILVSRIRKGISVSENLQILYENNLPLIKSFVKPYAVYETLEDLMQEAYFGIVQAVNHYETAENVKFMTYAQFWIKQTVVRYIEKCGSIVRISSHTRQRMMRYKKTVHDLGHELGRMPTDKEVASRMGISVELLPELRIQAQGVASLDAPVTDDEGLTLVDTIQADFCLEDETIAKIYDEHSKNELWGIVERYCHERENTAIREYFINNKSLREIAEEYGITHEAVRDAKEKGLQRLRIGKARRILLEKFDVVDAGIYRGGFNKFNEHGFTSMVEYTAIRREELRLEYERYKKEIENMLNQNKMACL